MMKMICFCGFLALVCVVDLPAQDVDAGKGGQTPQEFVKQVETYLREQNAAITQELKATRDALAKISADMEAQTNTINGLQEKSKELERQIAKLTMENAILKKQSAKLSAQLREEENLRKTSDLKLVEIVKQVAGREIATDTEEVKPTSTGDNRTYTVKRGDVLSNIALAFNTTVAAIQQVNNLNSTVIRPGQVLIIPGS